MSIKLWPLLAVTVFSTSLASSAQPRWDPQKTRVFVVSMTRFKGGVAAPWGDKPRLDYDLLKLLKARGVPEDQLVFLSDEQAESQSIRKRFDDLLSRSKADELLIFYFGSHGGYNPKRGTFTYSSFDGSLPFEWAFDSIESKFKGSQVIMLADCCYSGGIVELSKQRTSPIRYACLSSTYAHNVGYSGWRFVDCLTRGFSGKSVVDLDGNGTIELDELARFSERHMAFVAEGKPTFSLTRGFNPRLILADSPAPKKDPGIGAYLEALHKGSWYKAEVTDVRPGQLKVHLTSEDTLFHDWVRADQTRPFSPPHFPRGARVEISVSGQWFHATVKDTWESMHLCARDGYPQAYDVWSGPSRIRPARATNLSGNWFGYWENSSRQRGEDTLVLCEDASGNLTGTWTGTIELSGRRVDEHTARLEATTATRAYKFVASLQGGVLTLKYTARKLDSGGTYEGMSTLTLPPK